MGAGGLVVFIASFAIISTAAAAARDGSATALGAPPWPQLVRDVFLTKGPALDILHTPRTENSESLIPTKKPLPASAVALAWGVSFVVVVVAAVNGWWGGYTRDLRLAWDVAAATRLKIDWQRTTEKCHALWKEVDTSSWTCS